MICSSQRWPQWRWLLCWSGLRARTSWPAYFGRDSAHPGPDGIEGVFDLYAVSIGGMLMFCVFAYLGYRGRFRPVVHKRLMLFATFSLLDASNGGSWPGWRREVREAVCAGNHQIRRSNREILLARR